MPHCYCRSAVLNTCDSAHMIEVSQYPFTHHYSQDAGGESAGLVGWMLWRIYVSSWRKRSAGAFCAAALRRLLDQATEAPCQQSCSTSPNRSGQTSLQMWDFCHSPTIDAHVFLFPKFCYGNLVRGRTGLHVNKKSTPGTFVLWGWYGLC